MKCHFFEIIFVEGAANFLNVGVFGLLLDNMRWMELENEYFNKFLKAVIVQREIGFPFLEEFSM